MHHYRPVTLFRRLYSSIPPGILADKLDCVRLDVQFPVVSPRITLTLTLLPLDAYGGLPKRHAKGEPREYPGKTDELGECIGLPISQARHNSNEGVFERGAYLLEEENLKGLPFREILEEHVVSGSVDKPKYEKCCEKL